MRKLFIALALVLGVAGTILPQPAQAADLVGGACTKAGVTAADGSICDNPTSKKGTDIAKNVVDTLLYALGIVSVIMIIVGGLRYVLSAGDKSALVSAKNTIMYAVIGLAIAILGVAIAQFVVSRV